MTKWLFAIYLILGCASTALPQGLRGNITITGKASVVTTGHSVVLTWNAAQGGTTYNVYRGTTHGGPYSKASSGISSTTYTDVHVTHLQTLYYVTTAMSGTTESGYSNEVAAVIP
ncbi:MAG: hypothetical protein WAL71_14860 [Terriglobales bacterium]|jgi:fibronectin type 3 domain-containing protein